MHSFMLQDWITIGGGTGSTTVTQPEPDYLDLASYRDIAFWVDVQGGTKSGGTQLYLLFDTWADKSDNHWVQIASIADILPATPLTNPTVLAVMQANATYPLLRFVRWRLVLSGSPTAAWNVTLRIAVAANPVRGRVATSGSQAASASAVPVIRSAASMPSTQPGGPSVSATSFAAMRRSAR